MWVQLRGNFFTHVSITIFLGLALGAHMRALVPGCLADAPLSGHNRLWGLEWLLADDGDDGHWLGGLIVALLVLVLVFINGVRAIVGAVVGDIVGVLEYRVESVLSPRIVVLFSRKGGAGRVKNEARHLGWRRGSEGRRVWLLDRGGE